MKLIYDATLLATGKNKKGRTGIYFTVLNVLKELLVRTDVEIFLYCESKCYVTLLEEMERLFPENKFKYLSNTNSVNLLNIHTKLYSYKDKIRYSGKNVEKFFVQLGLMLFH